MTGQEVPAGRMLYLPWHRSAGADPQKGKCMSGNPYIDLLARFQEAYAELGGYQFWLGAVTPGEVNAHPQLRDGFVCVVPEVPSVWYLIGNICHASQFSSREQYVRLRDPILNAFSALAARAGAALPLSIRKGIADSPENTPTEPVSWWVTFLWRLCPPSVEDLTPSERGVRIACLSPFSASIDAIEIVQLNTDRPRFPPARTTHNNGYRATSEADEEQPPEGKAPAALKLSLSREKAFRQYQDAVGRNPTQLNGATDREVYDWLYGRREQGDVLQSFATWSRYLREAREFYSAQKNTARISRPTGKSVVRQDQI